MNLLQHVMFGTPFAARAVPGKSAWYGPDSPKWQDSARTTPATADTNPVGAWDDLSVSARHAIQATAGARPLLKTAIKNGYPAVRSDGVDDFLGIAVGGGALNQPAWEFVAFIMVSVSAAGNQTVVDGGSQSETRLLVAPSGGQMSMFAGVTLADVFTVTAGPVFIAACRFNGASSALQVNNRTAVAGNAGASAVTGLGIGGDGAQFANVDVLERIRVQGDIPQRFADGIRTYLNHKYSAY